MRDDVDSLEGAKIYLQPLLRVRGRCSLVNIAVIEVAVIEVSYRAASLLSQTRPGDELTLLGMYHCFTAYFPCVTSNPSCRRLARSANGPVNASIVPTLDLGAVASRLVVVGLAQCDLRY